MSQTPNRTAGRPPSAPDARLPGRRREGVGLWGFLILALWLVYVLPWWNIGLYVADEGFEGLSGWLILRGRKPFVDFFGPAPAVLGPLAHAALIAVFGPKLIVWRVMFVMVGGAICLLIYLLLTRIAPPSRAFLAAAVGAAIVLNAFLPPYWWYDYSAIALALLAALFVVRGGTASGRRGAAWQVLAGVTAASVFFAKPNIGAAAAAALLLSYPLAAASDRARLAALAPGLGSFLAGVALGGGLWFALMAQWGILRGYLEALGGSGRFAQAIYGQSGPASYLTALANPELLGAAPFALIATLAAWGAWRLAGRSAKGPLARPAFREAAGAVFLLAILLCAVGLSARRLNYLYPLLGSWLILAAWPIARGRTFEEPASRAALPTLLLMGSALWLSGAMVQPDPRVAASGSVLLFPLLLITLAIPGWSTIPRAWPRALWMGALVSIAADAVTLKWSAPYRHPPYAQRTVPFAHPNLAGLRGPPRFVEETHRMLAIVESRGAGETVFLYPDNFVFYVVLETAPPTPTFSYRAGAFAEATGKLEESSRILSQNPPDWIVIQFSKNPEVAESEPQMPYFLRFPPESVPPVIRDLGFEYSPAFEGRYYGVYRKR